MNIKYQNEPLKQACVLVGGQSILASLLGVACSTVNQWLHGIRPIPPKRCPQIEKITGRKVLCESLRGDIDWSYLRRTGSKDSNPELAQQKKDKAA